MDYRIRTDRLLLRLPLESDSSKLFELMSEPSLTKFLTWESHTNIDTTKNVIQSLITSIQEDKGYHWCICFENEIIGLVSLIDVKRTIRTWTLNRAELAYWISLENQGKGYATEASEAVIDFGFKNLDFHKIIVAHSAENTGSKSICNKLGFVQYAHEQDAYNKEGVWHDLFWYELIKTKR